MVAIENKTGEIKAMVGGSDYDTRPFNLATNGHRQPGSSFKPFTLITALEQGHSSGEVFTSAPQQIPFEAKVPKNNGNGTKIVNDVFRVNNYNDSYLGSASIATATTYSDNSVYAQLGTQVGPQNVAATAKAMGIDTDLSTQTQYSIEGGPFEPYNPALILGGLQTGVTSLEMAHAYNTLAANGRRLSGTMASSAGGPVGIVKVTDGDGFNQGDPVPDETGASGENKLVAKQVIDPGIAAETRSILATVVSSGTGRRAQNGEPTWGKTGTTDDNGDAWFCGATPQFTMCVWVGYPDKVQPMETEFAGGPVDGGTFPAEIFSRVANAYEAILAARKAGSDPNEGDSAASPSSITPTTGVTTTPSTDAPPATEAPSTPAPTQEDTAPATPGDEQQTAPPADGGGNGAPAAPAGGVSPG
jgi:penicillin-binding protein 1A